MGFGSLLVGFEYDKERKLPGTMIDIFRAREFFKSKSKIEDFRILSDIKEINNKDFLDGLSDGVSPSILTFFPSIKENYYKIFSLDDLIEQIQKYVTDKTFLVIYYSGHCRESQMILPSEETVSFSVLEMMIRRMNQDLELVFILDCCSFDSSTIKSPCVSSQITNPVSTKKGSLFTKELFQNLDSHQLPEWIFGHRTRVGYRNNFFLIFDLEKTTFNLEKYSFKRFISL